MATDLFAPTKKSNELFAGDSVDFEFQQPDLFKPTTQQEPQKISLQNTNTVSKPTMANAAAVTPTAGAMPATTTKAPTTAPQVNFTQTAQAPSAVTVPQIQANPYTQQLQKASLQQSDLFSPTQQAIQQQLSGYVPGFEEQAGIAREALRTQQQQAEAAQREALLSSGMGDTGKRLQFELATPAQQAREEAAFNRDLAASRGALEAQQKAAGISAASQLMGQQLQADVQQNIAQFQTDFNAWQQGRTEALTKAGMEFDAAMEASKQEADSIQRGLDRGLTKAIEQANLDANTAALAQQATQFTDKQAFDTWALQSGFDESARDRAWQAAENANSLAYNYYQTDINNQLTRDIEQGNIDVETAKMAQQAYQFATQQEFEAYALQQGITQEQAMAAWNASESALNRAHDARMKLLEQDFAEKNMNLSAVLATMEGMEPEQRADILNQIAINAGITYMDENGNEIPGIKPITETQQTIIDAKNIASKINAGETPTKEEIATIINDPTLVQQETPFTGIPMRKDSDKEPPDDIYDYWTGSGHKNRWVLNESTKAWAEDMQDSGGLFRVGNSVYTVVGIDDKDEYRYVQDILVKNAITGKIQKLSEIQR